MRQEKRNIQLIVSLGVLIIVTVSTWYFTFYREAEKVDKNVFKIENLKSIDKVVLTSSVSSVTLTLDGTRWKANDQSADLNMVDVLFATLQQAEPKYLIAAKLRDSISNVLETTGVNVSLYEAGELQKQFIAGGNMSKTQAYFKDLEDGAIYQMIIPGYRVYTSGIFELDENGWRDKYVFNFNWKNFKKLEASFPKHPDRDFLVEMGREYFEVKGIVQADTAKLNDFLDAISLTTVDEYLPQSGIANLDSIQDQSFINLLVSDITGKSYSLSLIDIPDKTNYLASVQGNYPAYINRNKATRILKEKKWFAGQ
jgi:hypothetical protein